MKKHVLLARPILNHLLKSYKKLYPHSPQIPSTTQITKTVYVDENAEASTWEQQGELEMEIYDAIAEAEMKQLQSPPSVAMAAAAVWDTILITH